MVFLVAAVSFLAKNITAFLIVESSIGGYMLIEILPTINTRGLSYINNSIRSKRF